jgi:hypothetical protein
MASDSTMLSQLIAMSSGCGRREDSSKVRCMMERRKALSTVGSDPISAGHPRGQPSSWREAKTLTHSAEIDVSLKWTSPPTIHAHTPALTRKP